MKGEYTFHDGFNLKEKAWKSSCRCAHVACIDICDGH